MKDFAAYFVYGLIEDVLAALYTKSVANGDMIAALLVTILIQTLAIWVLRGLIREINFLSYKFFGLLIGGVLGTWLVLRVY